MDIAAKNSSNPEKYGNKSLSLILIGVLLFLRIPFLTGLPLYVGESIMWVDQVFEVGTYLLTAILIWLERKRLDEFFITPLALMMILLFKPIMPLLIYAMGGSASPLSFPRPNSFMYLIISLGLFGALRLSGWSWKQVSTTEWKWLGWGTLAGFGLAILGSYPMILSMKADHGLYGASLAGLIVALIRVPQQLGYAAIAEEPLFRGFLWGALIKFGWKNHSILVFQTILFMLGHVFYLKNMPLMFWVVIPINGIFLGLLAWRSRTIVSSMAGHTIINAFSVLIAQFLG